MMVIPLNIFVSSTWLDLQPERKAVESVLQRMRETKFSGMEYFGSRDENTETSSLDEVNRSQVYIGIFARRYGSGITEKEYRRARELNLPCFIYYKREADISPTFHETDPQKTIRLAALKEELRCNHTITEFNSPADLAAKVTADMHRWLFDEYLTPKLEYVAKGTLPSAEANALLAAVRDTSGLNQALLLKVRKLTHNHKNITVGGNVDQSILISGNNNVIHAPRPSRALILSAIMLLILGGATTLFLTYRGANRDAIYRLHITAINPHGVPVEEANVWSSIGGDLKKAKGSWQLDIPAATKPQGGKLTIFASQESAFLAGEADVTLDTDYNPTVTLQLRHDKSAKIGGKVLDSRGRRVAGARVFVDTYEVEAVETNEYGRFELPAHAAVNESVLLHAEKQGIGSAILWHPAGDDHAELALRR